MEKEITRYDEKLAEMRESIRFYISTPERFAEALIFAKKLEDFAAEIKEKVKERGGEIMSNKDLREIEFGEFVIRKIEPSRSNEYNTHSVISTFLERYGKEEGLSMVAQFLKASTASLEKWFIKGQVPIDIIQDAQKGMKVRLKKGFIGLYPKKEKAEKDGPIYLKQ